MDGEGGCYDSGGVSGTRLSGCGSLNAGKMLPVSVEDPRSSPSSKEGKGEVCFIVITLFISLITTFLTAFQHHDAMPAMHCLVIIILLHRDDHTIDS